MWENKKKEKDTDGRSDLVGPQVSIDRSAIYNLLYQLASDNEEFFTKSPTWTSYGGRLIEACKDIRESTPELKHFVNKIQEIAPLYDFDDATPGNGFRSLVCICDTAVLHLVSLLKLCTEQRGNIMFRISHYCKELEAFNTVVHFLLDALPQTIATSQAMPEGMLFPPLDEEYEKWHDMLKGIEELDSSCFYGRPLGFQFSPSCGRIFRFIGIILATYSLSWEKGHGPIGSILNSGRFFLSPEQRASRIIKVTKEADIGFCKGFWNLSELGNNMPKWFCPNMAVNELREINWVGAINMETSSGGHVKIPEPSAHTGMRPVKIRVMSHLHRKGISPISAPSQQELSPYLLFHCHGGGYVATSSKSHETYLRVWAKLLNCTVVSVEYSLAPENPFPRPTEEVLFAYAWIVNNPHAVGWTGERICMVGDSAGGNLIMSVNLRLIQLDVERKPDGLVPVYTPFLFQYLPSPSRILSVMDPLLHMGVVLRCVAAYTGAYTFGGEIDNGNMNGNENGHKSLQEYVEQVQKTQRLDFVGGSQSIVSLVNLAHGNTENTSGNEARSFFQKQESTTEDNESNDSDDDDNRSVSSVRVDADPLHIHISSTLFDSELVEYLKSHPLTKDQVVYNGENGGTIPAPIEPLDVTALEAIDKSDNNNGGILSAITCSTSTHSISSTLADVPPKGSMQSSLSSHSLGGKQQNLPLSHKRSLSQSLADTAALAAGHALDNLSEWLDRPTTKSEKPKLDRAAGNQSIEETEDNSKSKSHLLELLNSSQVPRDPLISPIYASDAVIRQLPPCYFLACHLDPLLDDTIAFARKLRGAGGKVASIDLLPSVPHGFLNFTLMSPECRDGAKLCLMRIKQALGYPDVAASS